ncbi:MAG: EamA family transporter [Dongiaceae bacterium]
MAAYSYAVAVLGASKASAFVSLTPALTTLLATASLGEWPDAITMTALLVVGCGAALANGLGRYLSFKHKPLCGNT